MSVGFHDNGSLSILDVYFRGSAQPGAGEFKIRLGNSLLVRLTGISGTFSDGEVVTGDSSGDDGILESKENNPDGTITLKLSGIGETEVFTIGEGMTGSYSGATGTISNQTMALKSFSNGRFMLNEQVVGNSSGATADVVGAYGDSIAINNVSGSFSVDETITGQETNAQATLLKHHAGTPGLFDDDTPSEIIGEPTSADYSAKSLDANTTDFPTLAQDLNGNGYIQSKQVSWSADSEQIGPFNTVILTVTIDSGTEKIVTSGPLANTPPSEVITVGSDFATQIGCGAV